MSQSLDRIRHLLVEGEDFAEIQTSFFNALLSEPAQLGEALPGLGARLSELALRVLEGLAGALLCPGEGAFFRTEGGELVHGGYRLGNSQLGLLIYSPQDCVGLACLVSFAGPQPRYARFRVLPAPEGDPAKN